MKAIIVQRFPFVLRDIVKELEKVDRKLVTEIVFTSDTDEVLDFVRSESKALIISGQVFDSDITGTDLAVEVKKVNPQAIFFIYSFMPDLNSAVDGLIPKEEGHIALIRLLTSNLKGATVKSMLDCVQGM